MTQTASKTVEALEAELAEWKALAIENSIRADEAASLATAAAAHIVAGTPAPPPAPALPPPPPRPASLSAFLAMPAHEKARVREAFGGGDKLEEQLHQEFMNGLATRNSSRGDFSGGIARVGPRAGGPPVMSAEERARRDVAAYNVGAPVPIPKEAPGAASPRLVPGTFEYAQAACASANASIAADASRSNAPRSAVPFTPTSVPAQKPAGKFVRLRQ